MTNVSMLPEGELLTHAEYVARTALLDGKAWASRRLIECGEVLNSLLSLVAVRDARNTELERLMKSTAQAYERCVLQLSAAEKERDEALHKYDAACEAWGYSKARNVVLENALRGVEWIWNEEAGNDLCPACGLTSKRGHDRSCDLAAALAVRAEETTCSKCGNVHRPLPGVIDCRPIPPEDIDRAREFVREQGWAAPPSEETT